MKPTPEPVDYGSQLQAAFKVELSESNRDVARVESVVYNPDVKALVVTWAINENLTDPLTKAGAKLDLTTMLEVTQKTVKDGMALKEATFRGTYSLVDRLGNAREGEVVQASYSGTTVSKSTSETSFTATYTRLLAA